MRTQRRGGRLRFLYGRLAGIVVAAAWPDCGISRADLASDVSLLAAAPLVGEAQSDLAAAWGRAAAAAPGELPTILAGMKGASPIGENWLRSAVDAIAERESAQGRPLPRAEFEAFLFDLKQAPRARRVAFEWLHAGDAAAADRLLPRLLEDPSLELRHDAVEHLLAQADAAEGDAQRVAYRQALAAARDVPQIQATAEKLRGLGETVDVAGQMGFGRHWRLLGPLSNVGLTGFATAASPEESLDLAAKVPGKSGDISWKAYESTDDYGKINLNQAIADDKEVVAYAVARLNAEKPLAGQLRIGTPNALKVWFNGEQAAAYEVYHMGFAVDQYVVPVDFRAGENVVLVKICQNAREQFWEKPWEFQLRATDELGAALPVTAAE